MQNLGPCPEHLHPSPADSEPERECPVLWVLTNPPGASLGRRADFSCLQPSTQGWGRVSPNLCNWLEITKAARGPQTSFPLWLPFLMARVSERERDMHELTLQFPG